jgi:hypothetical protein
MNKVFGGKINLLRLFTAEKREVEVFAALF